MAGPGCASKTSRTGSSLPPMDRGWTSRRGRSPAMDGQTSSMWAPRIEVVVAREVVGVVLHERGAAGEAGGHDLHGADHRRGLPVALPAEAVAVGHQALDGESGELLEAVEVLERVGEGDEAAVGEEPAQAELDPRAVAQALRAVAARPELRRRRRTRRGIARPARPRPRPMASSTTSTRSPTPHVLMREAEPALGLHLVALGDGDLAHVVAEAGDPARLPVGLGARGARPRPDLLLDGRVAPVADDHLALEAQAGGDEPELPVAVGGLVEVHEVHVDVGPRDLAVVLRVEVQERLGEQPRGRRSTSWPG